jgi:SPP1 gp7 family putative phage head morphogenesis protein
VPLEAVLTDEALWSEIRQVLVRRVRPLFREAFLIGAVLGAQQRPSRSRNKGLADLADLIWIQHVKQVDPPVNPQLPFDLDAVVAASGEVIDDYTDDWWRTLDTSTRESLRRSIRRAEQQGLGLDAVLTDIEPLFGPARAQRIAVSETTNLMGQGAQETYRRAGFGEWEWRTVRDARVDPICESRDRQRFPMSQKFERAHPNCRCWPVPAGEATATGVPLEPPPEPVVPEAIPDPIPQLDAFGRLPQIDVDDFRLASEAIRENETETAVAWLRDGTRFEKSEGARSAVNFTTEEVQQFRGGVMVHNHPSSNSFSRPDVTFAHQNGLDEMHVVSRRSDYVLRITDRTRDFTTTRDLETTVRGIERDVIARFRRQIGEGSISIERAEATHWHSVWEEAQRRGIVQYEAFARDEELAGWYAEVTQAARGTP